MKKRRSVSFLKAIFLLWTSKQFDPLSSKESKAKGSLSHRWRHEAILEHEGMLAHPPEMARGVLKWVASGDLRLRLKLFLGCNTLSKMKPLAFALFFLHSIFLKCWLLDDPWTNWHLCQLPESHQVTWHCSRLVWLHVDQDLDIYIYSYSLYSASLCFCR